MGDLRALVHNVEIGSLDRAETEKTMPQLDEQPPIFTGIRVNKRRNLRRAHRLCRVLQQARVQAPLRRTCVAGRCNLRPSQVCLQELVGNNQPPPCVAIQQVVTTRLPEIADGYHRATLLARLIRSTSSAGCSSSADACKNA